MLLNSDNAYFYYEENDNCLVNELSDYLNKFIDQIYDFFNIQTKEKIKINIISKKETFDSKLKEEFNMTVVSKSSRGFFSYKDNAIYYLSINDYDKTTHDKNDIENYKKTLVHECVHYINNLFNKENNCGATALYLREGIAVYLSHQNDNKNLIFDYTLEDFLNNSKVTKNCYAGYYLIVKYLIENYDKSFVLDLFTSSRQANLFLKDELYEKANTFYNKKQNKI